MYRLVTGLLRPFNFVCLCTLAATVLVWRAKPGRRSPKIVLSICIGLLFLLSVRQMGYLATLSLESAYPPWDGTPERTDTIVVFSGGYHVYDESGKHVDLEPSTLGRCLHAARLYKKAGGCRIVVSGGKTRPDDPGPTLAGAMRDFLVDVGVRPSDILLEDGASSTYENAVNTVALLKEHSIRRVILVTDAMHMARSERCLRSQGVDVTPAACNYRATWYAWEVGRFLPSPEGVADMDAAMHEWVGIAWYWLRGRI